MNNEYKIGLEVKKLSNLFKRTVDRAVSKHGIEELTATQGFVIRYLCQNTEKNIYQKDLEKEFSVRRSTATALLQLMEKKGLILRVPDEKDHRLKKIVLTEKSLERHKIITAEIDKTEKKLLDGLTDDEVREFFRLINKISDNLGE